MPMRARSIKALLHSLKCCILPRMNVSTETAAAPARIEWIDLLKGLAIILVVMGHMPYDDGCIALKNGIYSFHMPLFFLLAGFTAALSMGRSSSPWRFMGKRLVGIFIPYLVWSFTISPLASLETYQQYSFEERANNFVTGNVACWFLPCLLGLQLLFALYTEATSRFRHFSVKIALCLILFGLVVICHKNWGSCHSGRLEKWDLDFLTSIYRYYIPFGMGVALYQYPAFKKFCSGNLVCTVCVLVVLLLTGLRSGLSLVFATHLRTVIGIAASLLLIRMFSGSLLPDWVNVQLKAIGKDTLIIYLISGAFLPYACSWFHGMDGTIAFLIYLPICIAICYFCMAIARMIATSPLLALLFLGKSPARRTAETAERS